MTQPEFTHRRYVQAEEKISEQHAELRRARHLIWTLFILAALMALALGFQLAASNFR